MVLDRVLRDEQLLGDVAVVHAARDQLEHLHLAVGELGRGDVLGALFLRVALGQRGELGEQLARHRGVDQRLAAVHRPDRLGHLVQRDVLQQIAAGAGPDRLEQVLFLVADRQHHDLRARRDVLGGAARLDATALRHPDVHEHDVGQRLPGHGYRLGAVARLPDQVDVVLFVEDHLQAAPEQRMIIRDQHPDRFLALLLLTHLLISPSLAAEQQSSTCRSWRSRGCLPRGTPPASAAPGRQADHDRHETSCDSDSCRPWAMMQVGGFASSPRAGET